MLFNLLGGGTRHVLNGKGSFFQKGKTRLHGRSKGRRRGGKWSYSDSRAAERERKESTPKKKRKHALKPSKENIGERISRGFSRKKWAAQRL